MADKANRASRANRNRIDPLRMNRRVREMRQGIIHNRPPRQGDGGPPGPGDGPGGPPEQGDVPPEQEHGGPPEQEHGGPPEQGHDENEHGESETFVYIYHGMVDETDDQLDTDEDLEKRQKYIYDLRYWAWKRLNLQNENPIRWENVNAYYYNHSSDSVWSQLFSPPVYWSPLKTNKEALGKWWFGDLYKFDVSEIAKSNIEMIREIAEQINDEKTVLLYGFSVGGFVVHRICEVLSICAKNAKLSELILGIVLEQADLDNLKVATFGSSYLSPIERVSNIENITNYVLVDDVVTRTNLFDFGLGFVVPSFEDNLFTKDDGYLGFIRTTRQAKLYEFMQYYDTNIVYLQKWEKGWWFSENREGIEKKNFTEYEVGELKELYNKHNSKYDLLFNKLLKNQVTNYLELTTIEFTNQSNVANPREAPAVVAVPVVVAVNIEVEAPLTTVDELVNQGIVRFDNNFYRDQLNYIQDPPRKTRIDNALRLAQEAREELDESMRRRGEQNAQRDARVKRRTTVQEVRNEMNDISHHTADSILQLHETQHIPVLIAEEPEQDILDFSLIMAQLETKAMFLEGDGLKSLRAITRAAIDRGKANRANIPAAVAAAAAAAGGGRRRKNVSIQQPEDNTTAEPQEGFP